MMTRRAAKRTERAVDALLSDATAQVNSKFKAVSVHAKLLGEYMGDLHGGDWTVDVDHAAGFILIKPSAERVRAST